MGTTVGASVEPLLGDVVNDGVVLGDIDRVGLGGNALGEAGAELRGDADGAATASEGGATVVVTTVVAGVPILGAVASTY